MNIPYRTRRVLNRLGIAALIILMIFVLIWFCWVIWLDRYIIYTRDGAVIDFDLPQDLPQGEIALPPSDDTDVQIYFNEGENSIETSNELTQLSGYYIDTKALAGDVAGLLDTVRSLPSGTPVMIDMKSIKGYFYYSTGLTDAEYANVDINTIDALVSELTTGNYYAIARIPAFRDFYYGLNHVSCGLAVPKKGYLWMDEEGCYWLNPTNSETLNRIIQIVEELKRLGFDEVVLSDFRFPTTENISFDGDKSAALTSALNTLLTNCGTSSFTLSFGVSSSSFALPDGRSRLYLEGVEAKNVGLSVSQAVLTDPKIRLVFVTSTNDTRYNEYGVLRSIDLASLLRE